MIDFLTGLALVGVAVTAIACAIAKLVIENWKRKIEDRPQFLARKSLGGGGSILHSPFTIHTAVFIFFAVIAVQYAGAKHGGTNSPPLRGASVEFHNSTLLMYGHASECKADISSGAIRGITKDQNSAANFLEGMIPVGFFGMHIPPASQ